MASTSSKNISEPRQAASFVGPAQEPCDSLLELAISSLDRYFIGWNELQNPRNFILPQIFHFKNAEFSTEAYQSERRKLRLSKSKNIPHSIRMRDSDNAERMIYDVISRLVDENIGAPFMAFHSLDVKEFFEQVKKHSVSMEPWKNGTLEGGKLIFKGESILLREHDFILIGPNIGVIVIEVKWLSSDTKFEVDKVATQFSNGIHQAEAINDLLTVAEFCTGCQRPSAEAVRKFLFTPNLSREIYDRWENSIETPRFQGVEKWFQEDSTAKDLYSKLKSLLLENRCGIPMEIYHAYVQFMVAISSAVFLSIGSQSIFLADKLNLSKYQAAIRASQLVDEQNPLQEFHQQPKMETDQKSKGPKAESGQVVKGTILKRASRAKLQLHSNEQEANPLPKSMVVFLTPDQQSALEGPDYQFIVGAAGTGKSIILQTMALQVLGRKQSLAIISPDMYASQYRTLFENEEFSNFEFFPASITSGDFGGLCQRITDRLNSRCSCSIECECGLGDILEFIENAYDWNKEDDIPVELRKLLSLDNIIIDDAFDLGYSVNSWDDREDSMADNQKKFNCFLFPFILIVAARRLSARTRRIWVALDPHVKLFWSHLESKSGCDQIADGLMAESQDNLNQEYFSVSVLHRVMRCSESIYRAYYRQDLLGRQTNLKLGHKIFGPKAFQLQKIDGLKTNFHTEDEAKLAMWNQIKDICDQLGNDEIDLRNVAIIDGCKQLRGFLIDRFGETGLAIIAEENIVDWDQVSSMEWPIVIFVSCLQVRQHFDQMHEQYRAFSRATGMLFEISFTYDPPEDPEFVPIPVGTRLDGGGYLEVSKILEMLDRMSKK